MSARWQSCSWALAPALLALVTTPVRGHGPDAPPGLARAAHRPAPDAAAQGTALRAVDPWIRYQGDITSMSAGYITLENPGATPVVVRRVTCTGVRMVTIHESVERNGLMRMVERDSLLVPPGGRSVMRPGGVHLMLMGLGHALNVGERQVCTVHSSAGALRVDAPIRAS